MLLHLRRYQILWQLHSEPEGRYRLTGAKIHHDIFPYYTELCCTMLYHILHNTVQSLTKQCYAILYSTLLYSTLPYFTLPYSTLFCYVMLCYALFCSLAEPCRAAPRRAVPCRAVLCYTMLCYAILTPWPRRCMLMSTPAETAILAASEAFRASVASRAAESGKSPSLPQYRSLKACRFEQPPTCVPRADSVSAPLLTGRRA